MSGNGSQVTSIRAVSCRSCGEALPAAFLSLGNMPVVNRLLSESQLNELEPGFPLELVLCENCGLVQITEAVDPEVLFPDDYPYRSAMSRTFLQAAEDLAGRLIADKQLGSNDLVVELGSNDGYLLQYYARTGVPVLGIDPATDAAQQAIERGVPTRAAFFTDELAGRLRDEGMQARVIHANNVLAHVPDLNGFVRGMSTLLAPDGVVIIEAPYLRNLVERCEFDTIYHEHHCYFSVTSLAACFARHSLSIRAVEHIPAHGGSLRVFADKQPGPSAEVEAMLDEERRLGMDRADYYRRFAEDVEAFKRGLRDKVLGLKGEGRSIAAYGAAAKGCILLNYCGLGTDKVDFVADRAPEKQGHYMPGVRLPISPPERILEDQPDYLLILVWNLADEIVRQEDEYRRRGGRIITPGRQVRVLDPA